MVGRFTFHFAHSPPKRFCSAFFLALFLLSPLTFADSKNTTLPPSITGSTRQEIEEARTRRAEATTLQTGFATSLYDRSGNILSDIVFHVAEEFQHTESGSEEEIFYYKLNTVGGRGMHDTDLYLDNLSPDEAAELARVMMRLTPEKTKKYGLDKPVKLFDGRHVQIATVGTRSRFFGIHPDPEYVAFHMNLIRFFKDEAPWLIAKHLSHGNLASKGINASDVHISLAQFGRSVGADMPAPIVEREKNRLEAMIRRRVEVYRAAHGGEYPVVYFDPRKTPIQLIRAPVSFMMAPDALMSFRMNDAGGYDVSPVMRWPVRDSATGFDRLIEFRTQDAVRELADKLEPLGTLSAKVIDKRETWVLPQTVRDGESIEQFRAKLSPQMQETLDIVLKRTGIDEMGEETDVPVLSPTRYPAPIVNTITGDTHYVAVRTHGDLRPEKGFAKAEVVKRLGFQSTEKMSAGASIYASTLRGVIKNAGDLDTKILELAYVPDSVQTLAAAREYAVDTFIDQAIGHMRNLVREGKITITEMRIASEATLGIKPKKTSRDPLGDMLEQMDKNPYWSEAEIMRGYKTIDGHTITLKQALLAGDFIKGKIMSYPNGPGSKMGDDISVQFLLGLVWRKAVYSAQRNGLKGIPSDVRTEMHMNAESKFVAMSLSRAKEFSNSQKSWPVARSVRDLSKSGFDHPGVEAKQMALLAEPLWNSKFLKRDYGLLYLAATSGSGIDEILFNETVRRLRLEGVEVPEGYNMKAFTDRLLQAINQDIMATINSLKRRVNDLREFNERGQEFAAQHWNVHRHAIDLEIKEIERAIETGTILRDEAFVEGFRRFKKVFYRLKSYANLDEAVVRLMDPSKLAVFENAEHQLSRAEGFVAAINPKTRALTDFDKQFVKTMTKNIAFFLMRYIESRSMELDSKFEFMVRSMGFSATPENLALMRKIANNLDSMSKTEVDNLISKIESTVLHNGSECEEFLTDSSSHDPF